VPGRRAPRGLPLLSSAADALRAARPALAPGVVARRVTAGGAPAWVLTNPATGRYFQLSPRLYALAGGLDGRRTVDEALARLPPGEESEAQLLEALLGMTAAGLLVARGARLPERPRDRLAPLRALVFRRIPLGDVGDALGPLGATLGRIFSPAGFALLALLLVVAGVAVAGRSEALTAQFARVADAGLAELALGYLVFVLAKLLHEAGHAAALARAARAEGVPLQSAPFGVSFMFLLPAPYVDASAAWLIESRARRAVVGLAGVVTDLWVAALAALAWASIGPGALADRLFELVLICGVSSLLFNLNPLVRLDGYHVLADLLGVPNLMARAQAALSRVLLGPLGLAARPAARDLPGALFAFLSWLYRWTIYLAVFWLAAGLHPALGTIVALTVLVLFVAVPLLRALGLAPGAARESPLGLAAGTAAGLALAAALAFVPVPRFVVAEGVVAGPGLAFAYPRTDGRILTVAAAGPAGAAPVLALDNPETARQLAQLRAEAESLAVEARQARATGAPRMDAAPERARAVAQQIARLEEERAAQELRAEGLWWEPLRAERLAGAWVRRDDQRPLGALIRADARPEILLVLDQWDGPFALAALAGGEAIPMRLAGGTRASFHARPQGPVVEAREALPSPALGTPGGGRIPARLDERDQARPVERVFELRLAPEADAPPLRPGQRVEARIPLPPAPLAEQAWRRARQVVQQRLSV
jgi:putative peptide zinc metalloprotease protein